MAGGELVVWLGRYVGWRALVALLLCLLTGCGDAERLAPVAGRATLDGKPLGNVLVTFIPEANGGQAVVRSMGVTDGDGAFELKAETQQKGAVWGLHRVIIEDLTALSAPRAEDGTLLEPPVERFPKRYSAPLSSPLKATVVEGANSVQLKLETAGP